jgi:hypothetical protein
LQTKITKNMQINNTAQPVMQVAGEVDAFLHLNPAKRKAVDCKNEKRKKQHTHQSLQFSRNRSAAIFPYPALRSFPI